MAIHTQRVLKGVRTQLDSPFARAGQRLLGWSTDKQSLVVEYTDKGEYEFNENISLYAVWETIPVDPDTPDTPDTPDDPGEQATYLTAENGNLITTENTQSEDNIIVE